jgi:hypothetical protein
VFRLLAMGDAMRSLSIRKHTRASYKWRQVQKCVLSEPELKADVSTYTSCVKSHKWKNQRSDEEGCKLNASLVSAIAKESTTQAATKLFVTATFLVQHSHVMSNGNITNTCVRGF